MANTTSFRFFLPNTVPVKILMPVMIYIFLFILVLIAMLSVYVIWQGTNGETHRRQMERSLKKSEIKSHLHF